MQLEIEDIQQFIPQIAIDLRNEITKALEEERFISYHRGMAKFLYGDEIDFEERANDKNDRTHYQRIQKFWKDPKFPKIKKNGVEGVMLSDFKNYLKY